MLQFAKCHLPHTYKEDSCSHYIDVVQIRTKHIEKLINHIHSNYCSQKNHKRLPPLLLRTSCDGNCLLTQFTTPIVPAVKAHDEIIPINNHIAWQLPLKKQVDKYSCAQNAEGIHEYTVTYGKYYTYYRTSNSSNLQYNV